MSVQPPRDLSANAVRFWHATIAELNLSKAHHFEMLEIACRALDEIEAARKILKKQGLTLATQHSAKVNPAFSIERGAREDFTRAMRQLKPKREELREEKARSKFRVMQFQKPSLPAWAEKEKA
jgi:phage terminase small subunit